MRPGLMITINKQLPNLLNVGIWNHHDPKSSADLEQGKSDVDLTI